MSSNQVPKLYYLLNLIIIISMIELMDLAFMKPLKLIYSSRKTLELLSLSYKPLMC